MISSLEHRCSRVEAGPGRYFMKNGVNRCGTNRTERRKGRLRGGGGRRRKGEEKEGEKEWASSRASSAAGDVFLSCVRGNVVRAPDVKCMYNLQTENYFNCSAKHPAASINQRGLCATREKKKSPNVLFLAIFLSRVSHRGEFSYRDTFDPSTITSSSTSEYKIFAGRESMLTQGCEGNRNYLESES